MTRARASIEAYLHAIPLSAPLGFDAPPPFSFFLLRELFLAILAEDIYFQRPRVLDSLGSQKVH